MTKRKDKLKKADTKKISKKYGAYNRINILDAQIKTMENMLDKVIDKAWTDYTIYSMSKTYDAVDQNSAVQDRMNKVKKDAEESKAIEELGKQLIYKMLRQMETNCNTKDIMAFRKDYYAAIDDLKASRLKQQALTRSKK